MASIKHLFHINGPKEEVYNALTSIDGLSNWWTVHTSGEATPGWKEENDFFGACSFSWGRYMESLRQLCQAGKGEAFGSEGYRR